MKQQTRRDILSRIEDRFEHLYGSAASECVRRLKLLLSTYEDRLCPLTPSELWGPADNVLITYGDMVQRPDEAPLATLDRFLSQNLQDVIDTVHVLPFFPYSSDDGFSVINYRRVNPALGDWDDVHALASHFRLMFDLVLNHCSKRNDWFRDYVTGIAPARYYFIEMAPGTDLSNVVRPRATPLLTKVRTRAGEKWVWTTFSDDQVDLDFSNPDVLLEFIDILLRYITHGARIIRLDAIAYLWKQVSTSCIHLPQTHEVVKLLRDLVDLVAPHVLLLTETNVPHRQNISYFGHGDEAHIVYNFSLPPLLMHALQSGTAKHMTKWAAELDAPPPGCTYLNFTASHDGIGVRPAEGLLDTAEIRKLCDLTRRRGGFVSNKTNPDGSESPYELNITYFDAMGGADGHDGTEQQIQRFLCSQTIMLALRGIPAVYFHSLTATPNDTDAVERLGYPRAINRRKWSEQELTALLADEHSPHRRVYDEYRRRLKIRARQPAFHPDGDQRVFDLDDGVFALERRSPDGSQTLLSLSNVSDRPVSLDLRGSGATLAGLPCRDLLARRQTRVDAGQINLSPYQTRWLTPVPAG